MVTRLVFDERCQPIFRPVRYAERQGCRLNWCRRPVMNTRPLLCIILFSSAALCFGLALAAEPPSAAGSTEAGNTAPGSAPTASASEPLAPGSWQKHQYSFQFMGFTSTYSCDGLADKLRILLIAAGARADAKASPGACAAGFGRPDKFARADLSFYTLAPDGTAAPAAAARADGAWRPVRFAPHLPRGLQIGDCEVVEQFTSAVLPMFATRNVTNKTTCVPKQESGSDINLQFDAFVAVPAVA